MFCGHLCTSFCLTPVSNSLGFRISSGIAGSPDRNSVSNYLRNRQSVFHSGCTVLHPHQQYIKVPVSPQSQQHLLFSVLFCFLIIQAAQCYVTAWMGEESRGEWIHVYVCLSHFAVHLEPSQHC